MKTPKFLTKFAAIMTPRPKKKYQAAVRTARPAPVDHYEDDQPTTRLSSAFIVVLILHVVAVGGIYAFNSIKASRRNHEQVAATVANPAPPVAAKTVAATGTAPAASPMPAANPITSHPANPTIAPAPAAPAISAKPGTKQYQVKSGDNPTKIAFAYRISPAELLAANNLKDNAVLHIGQMLTIPAPKSDAKPQASDAHKAETPAKLTDIPPTTTTPGLYLVKKGDTAHSIAKAYGMTVEELIKMNKITDPKKLQPGQALKIPPRKS